MASLTDLYGRFILAVFVIAMLCAAARAAFSEPTSPAEPAPRLVTPAQAIERAVEDRLGAHAQVQVTALDTRVTPDAALHAMPEPGGRAGAPMRFVLMTGRVRRGIAVATVAVTAPHARASRTIARNDRIDADAVDVVTGELPGIAIGRLPEPADVIGLTARRDIARGEPLTQVVLAVPPAIKAGEAVVLTVVAGSVQITTRGIASASGHEGDVIRVVPQGGRALKARITGPGTVEVRQ